MLPRFCFSTVVLVLLLLSFTGIAQNTFVEGIISYSVSVEAGGGQPGMPKQAGSYRISVKGKMVRRELKMANGYQNTVIFDGNDNTIYSLQTVAGKYFAVQLDFSDCNKKQQGLGEFSVRKKEGLTRVAGRDAGTAELKYKDGTVSSIYYFPEWEFAEKNIFDRFPGLTLLPLAFEYKNEEGRVMHFEAEQLEAAPVESALFRIPPGYRIISAKEFREMED